MKPYKLTHQEWVEAVTSLAPAELKLLYYVKTRQNTPVDIEEVAKILKLDPETLRRCLRTLRKKGWLDFKGRTTMILLPGQSSDTSRM